MYSVACTPYILLRSPAAGVSRLGVVTLAPSNVYSKEAKPIKSGPGNPPPLADSFHPVRAKSILISITRGSVGVLRGIPI